MEEFIWLIGGFISLAIGSGFYFLTNGLSKKGIKTKARVKDHKLNYDAEDGSTFHEVFEFEDESGKLHRVKSMFSSSFRMYSVGEVVEILYDPDNPDRAMPNNRFLLNFYILPIIVGVVLIVLHFFIG